MKTAKDFSEQSTVCAACESLGVPRSSYYRAQQPKRAPEPRPTPERALSQEEQEQVHQTLNSERFQDSTPRQVYATLLGETHRRGLETAAQVVAVTDGAIWEQGFIDYHRNDAARVLDFPHAAGYVAQIGSAVWGADTETTQDWLGKQLHTLKHEGPSEVLSELRTVVQDHPELPELDEGLAYLEKREAQMQYPMYLAQGWPIGSG